MDSKFAEIGKDATVLPQPTTNSSFPEWNGITTEDVIADHINKIQERGYVSEPTILVRLAWRRASIPLFCGIFYEALPA